MCTHKQKTNGHALMTQAKAENSKAHASSSNKLTASTTINKKLREITHL